MGMAPPAPYIGVPLRPLIWKFPPPAPYMGALLRLLLWEFWPLIYCRSSPPTPSPPKSNSCYTMETNRIVSLWELVHFHLNLFSRWLVLMTDLYGCGRRLMNLCLWKKKESRFELMSFFSVCFYLRVLSFECKINWILLFFRRERRSLKRVLHRTQNVW